MAKQGHLTRVFHGHLSLMRMDCLSSQVVKAFLFQISNTSFAPLLRSPIVSQFLNLPWPAVKSMYTGHASNNNKASVPWNLIANDPDKFIDPVYLPIGVRLLEISKMKSEALHSCYSYWYKRQDRGEQAFLFKHVHFSDLRTPRNKRKRDVEGDNEEDEEIIKPLGPQSPTPQRDHRYVATLLVLSRALTITRMIENPLHKSAPLSRSSSFPHNMKGASGKSKGQPIEL
jgi:hypothetical protein